MTSWADPDNKRHFRIWESDSQEIEIHVQGQTLKYCDTHADPDEPEGDLIYPNPVKLFMECANLGMFCGRGIHPRRSRASLLKEAFDPVAWSQTWLLQIENIDPAAIRVLFNLLAARDYDTIRIQSMDGPKGQETPQLLEWPGGFPGRFSLIPFSVDADPPEQSTCARSWQVRFQKEPSEEVLESTYEALSKWALLPALGGFAPEDLSPDRSFTIPDIAFLLDPTTIEQGFQEIFECDEAAFDAVINWAAGFHDRFPIQEVCIR